MPITYDRDIKEHMMIAESSMTYVADRTKSDHYLHHLADKILKRIIRLHKSLRRM